MTLLWAWAQAQKPKAKNTLRVFFDYKFIIPKFIIPKLASVGLPSSNRYDLDIFIEL